MAAEVLTPALICPWGVVKATAAASPPPPPSAMSQSTWLLWPQPSHKAAAPLGMGLNLPPPPLYVQAGARAIMCSMTWAEAGARTTE